MHKQIAEVVDALEHAERRLEKLAETIPAERWNVRNDPDRWSLAECVAHLNLTSEAYVPRVRKAIAEARQLPPMTKREYRRDKIGLLFSVMVGPLPLIAGFRIGRVKTTPAFVPSGNLPEQQLLAEFKRHQLELIGMARESDGKQIDKVSITSPFGERIHYNCYSTFLIVPRHQERHLQQAELVWHS
ncbi:MAG: DinB family protein [Gemmatimonadales bacterium]